MNAPPELFVATMPARQQDTLHSSITGSKDFACAVAHGITCYWYRRLGPTADHMTDARGSKTVDDWMDASKRRAGLAHDTSQATQNLHFFRDRLTMRDPRDRTRGYI